MYKYKLILIFCLALIAVSVSGCETAGVYAKKNPVGRDTFLCVNCSY